MKLKVTECKRMSNAFLISLVAAAFLASLIFAPASCAAQAENRAEAEKAIRKAIYDLEYAYATGDAETVKRLSARRTLELYRLGMEMMMESGLAKNPNDASETAKTFDADKMLALMSSETASAVRSQISIEEIKRRVQKDSQSPLVFANPRRVEIKDGTNEPAFAVYEDGAWKIDDTANVKRQFLAMPGLSREDRERIRRF